MITDFIDESGTLAPDPEGDLYTVALLTAHDAKRAAQFIAQKVLVEERVKGIEIAALPKGR